MTIKKLEKFDEEEKAQEILSKEIWQKINKKDIITVAKHFYSLGYSKNKLKKELIKICKERYIDFNEVIYQKTINDAVKKAIKYPLRLQKDVEITKNELVIIKQFPYKYAKVLFIMLVYAKHTGFQINKKGEKVFYCNRIIEDVLGAAKLRMSYYEIWKDMMHSFCEKELVHLVEGTENLFRINFVEESGETEVIVSDMDNIVDFFPAFCEKCGSAIERTGRQIYCIKCKKILDRERKY
jgi:hypothetical protein